MRKALGCAALSCVLRLADAKALKWSDDGPKWLPARATLLGFMPSLGGMEAPTPTPPPAPVHTKRRLEARASDDNTCGYVDGSSDLSLYCDATARCVVNEANSHVGCCKDGETSCPVWTACYDSTDSDSYTTSNGRTMWCGNSQYPYCTTYIYQDDVFTGSTLLGCAKAAGTGEVWYLNTDTDETTSPTSPPTSPPTSRPTLTPIPRPTVSPNTPDVDPSDDPPPSPSSDPAVSSSSSSSSTPIGPIVGGVVGGLGAIALIILIIWLVMRQNKKNKAAAAAAAGGAQPSLAGGPQDHPHMSQQQPPPPPQGYYGAAAPPFDPRASIAKPGMYAGNVASNTPTTIGTDQPGSPPPPVYHASPSPPPPQGQFGQGGYGYGYAPGQGYEQGGGFGNVSPPPPPPGGPPGGQQMGGGVVVGPGGYQTGQQQMGYSQGYAATELPAQRGDGELRELHG